MAKAYRTSEAKRKAMREYYITNKATINAQKKKKKENEKNGILKKNSPAKKKATPTAPADPKEIKKIRNAVYQQKLRDDKAKQQRRKEQKTDWARNKTIEENQIFIDEYNKDYIKRYGK